MKRTVRVAGIFAAVLACSIVAGCGGGGGGGAGPQQASRPPEPETTETEAERAAREEAARRAEAERAAREEAARVEAERRAREAAVQTALEEIDGLDLTANLPAVGVREAYKNVVRASGGGVPYGAGVTIGFIDTGIEQMHPAFADGTRADGTRTVTEEVLEGTGDLASDLMPTESRPGGRSSHGTAVASVAAGAARNAIIQSRTGSRIESYTELRQGVAPGAHVRMFAITLGSGGGNTKKRPCPV